MRKSLFLLTSTVVLALAAGSAWADNVNGLTTFTSGTKAYADSINANFSEIEDSVNDNYARLSNTKTLPDGVTTSFFGRVAVPSSVDTTTTTNLYVYISGCSGSAVRIGNWTSVINLGTNPLVIALWSGVNKTMAPAVGSNYSVNRATFFRSSTTYATGSILNFGIRREGGNAGDTCGSNASLYGVKVDFPLIVGGYQSVWIPASDID